MNMKILIQSVNNGTLDIQNLPNRIFNQNTLDVLQNTWIRDGLREEEKDDPIQPRIYYPEPGRNYWKDDEDDEDESKSAISEEGDEEAISEEGDEEYFLRTFDPAQRQEDEGKEDRQSQRRHFQLQRIPTGYQGGSGG